MNICRKRAVRDGTGGYTDRASHKIRWTGRKKERSRRGANKRANERISVCMKYTEKGAWDARVCVSHIRIPHTIGRLVIRVQISSRTYPHTHTHINTNIFPIDLWSIAAEAAEAAVTNSETLTPKHSNDNRQRRQRQHRYGWHYSNNSNKRVHAHAHI